MERTEWSVITKWKLTGFGVGVGLFFLLVLASEPGFVFIVDHANLLFHEAGHPIFGLFSARLETYGGTIGQLVFPVVLAVSFWRKGQTLSFAGAWIWFFENWLNIARYLADARAGVAVGRRWRSRLASDSHALGIIGIRHDPRRCAQDRRLARNVRGLCVGRLARVAGSPSFRAPK